MSYENCVSLKPYGSIAEAAEMVGIPEKLVRERVTTGAVRCIMSGRKYYVDIFSLLENLRAEGETRTIGGTNG